MLAFGGRTADRLPARDFSDVASADGAVNGALVGVRLKRGKGADIYTVC